MTITTDKRIYTFDEYLELEETANFKHEYQDGDIVPMTGGTTEHNKIALNFAAHLKFALKGQKYNIFISDVKLWIPESRQGTYPDMMMIEGEPIYYGNGKTTVTNPSLIVEVLSKSTQNYDQGDKFLLFMKYKELNKKRISPNWCLMWGNLGHREYTFKILNQLAMVNTQPVFSPDKKFCVIGDTWLINQTQILEKLGVNSVNWRGTELEIIAIAWQKWGEDCLKEIQGIFGLIIWEQERNHLWLVRDPVGGRTLYYTNIGSTYYIAPRLKNLLSYHSKQLDLIALRDYLSTAFVPGERTLWENVKELRPGTLLSLPENKIECYWQPREQIIEDDQSLAWHGEKLRLLLEQIIQEYLPINQPVGVYLSGGLDSSAITALAAKFHPSSVYTYSLFFGDDCPHELDFSSRVAQFCQTQHQILEISPKKMWNQFPETMANLDDPIGDPLTVPNYLLAHLAQKDVQIVLNGEGGDPCFGGPKNQPMLLKELYYKSPDKSSLISAYLTSFQKCYLDLPNLLKPDIWEAVRAEAFPFETDLNSEGTYLNRMMSLNIKFKGADHILTKVNNLTRSAFLEGRSPLFDQRVVELAMRIPPQYKLAGAEEKAVLKQAVLDLLPMEIIKRPKSGMMVPVQLWFKKYWQREARGLLLSKRALISPYLNQSLLKDWLNYQGDTWSRYGVKLWLLVSLEIWLQMQH